MGKGAQRRAHAFLPFEISVVTDHVLPIVVSLDGYFPLFNGTTPSERLGMKPPTFLKAGDVATLGIDGLWEQKQRW